MVKRLLIVEDELNLCKIVYDYFTKRDFDVTMVNNGNDAINLLNDTTFDIILLDIMMPGIDGLMVCEKIRKKYNLPIIFVTALADEETQLKGYYLGADDYITKPYSLAILHAKVMTLLKRYSNSIVQNGLIIKKDLDKFEQELFIVRKNLLSLTSFYRQMFDICEKLQQITTLLQ